VAVGTISKCGSAKDEIHLVKNEKRSLLFISSLHLFHLLLLLKLSLPEKKGKKSSRKLQKHHLPVKKRQMRAHACVKAGVFAREFVYF